MVVIPSLTPDKRNRSVSATETKRWLLKRFYHELKRPEEQVRRPGASRC